MDNDLKNYLFESCDSLSFSDFLDDFSIFVSFLQYIKIMKIMYSGVQECQYTTLVKVVPLSLLFIFFVGFLGLFWIVPPCIFCMGFLSFFGISGWLSGFVISRVKISSKRFPSIMCIFIIFITFTFHYKNN